MTQESAPSSESILPIGEFSADQKTWSQVRAQCEVILGGLEGKKLSQRTWEPDRQKDALRKLEISYGLTMVLARIGQTEPTPDTTYELTFNGHNYHGTFLFEPYKPDSVATLTGDQPKLVPESQMPQARLAMLVDYLNTYLGEDNG